ncbi:tRNA pseudouridine(55) synthase TruB [Aquibacillus rhizosphaerae]|uniref:tRNA pseudouridine synthase B n=1 Tax=Aquibacillus rhizosphaerae TaxID=3051431 RepID=A0ABT7L2M3_9BACI|nr:tRNA pseudouridine(55) synthase TruB [Aquibacillus sp. LR5S19]MDL4840108.1 tRNA pseudouridine(55) synthase TruB [Aquibacillus sp. LR5S19]
MDGILPLWKPKGLTSHDCVFKVRKLLKTKKVGHTGTLDPEVEGVLPICIGQATKVVPYLTDTQKTYIAEITLGVSTETEDSHGDIVEKREVTEDFDREYIDTILKQFKGPIMQTPPMYSAVKVNGKKLYEYAREGVAVERPERRVVIDEIELLTNRSNHNYHQFSFRVECSKGTYIRTLCVDIGKALGYPAHMSNLIRLQTGGFNKEETFTFKQIEQAVEQENIASLLLPIQTGVKDMDIHYIDSELLPKVLNGQKFPIPKNVPLTNPFRVQLNDQLIAIYEFHPKNNNEIKPVRLFHTNIESR